MIIQSPYRSVPRYLSVSGTLIRLAEILTALERPDAAVVRNARLYRSFERPSGVLRSNGRKRATDRTCLAVFSGTFRTEEVIGRSKPRTSWSGNSNRADYVKDAGRYKKISISSPTR
jgi:hypothetical protein